jgi:cytidine deaminase
VTRPARAAAPGADSIQRLREAAASARDAAYVPYSGFRVGAAILASDGSIGVGCNVENASYGACLCAERAAVAGLVVRGLRELELMVLVTDALEPTVPCGICRQVLAELAPALPVVSVSASGEEARWTIAELLPSPFTQENLRHV